MLKGALWGQFRLDWLISALFALIGESTGILQCYYLATLIKFIQNKDKSWQEGCLMLTLYACLTLTQQFCRNFYIHYAFMAAIRMRRTLVSAMYDKVTRLSMKSLLATNSGKLIAVISSDLFTIERSLIFLPLLMIFAILNLFTYTMIGLLSSWTNSFIVFSVWLLMLAL